MSDNALQPLMAVIQNASFADTAEKQVQMIVDAISDNAAVDVCSLYRQNTNGELILLASHGLCAKHPVVIPAGKGLVGHVLSQCHSINIINPALHPDYFYVPQSQEDQFHSFCGIPLVYQGNAIGVLVTQGRNAVLLEPAQEALLNTLAAHLALLVSSLPQKYATVTQNRRCPGISGASGLAIGYARLTGMDDLMLVAESDSSDSSQTMAVWRTLSSQVIAELRQERADIAKSLGENLASIFDAYQLLLQDPAFDARIVSEIDAGKSLPWALKLTVQFFADQFRVMEDPYLQARHEDIEHLGNKIYRAWLGQAQAHSDDHQQALVLIGKQISVSDIVSLPADRLAGIVCFSGAALSHIAVFANAMNIPAVMGVGELVLHEGEKIVVDGDSAQVILAPDKALIEEYRNAINSHRDFDNNLKSLNDRPAETLDGTSVKLLVNSGLQVDIMPGIENGAEGIGLYRTEIPFMVRQNLPSELEQIEVYQHVIEAYKGKPVYIRTLDIGGDKPLHYMPHVEEENPALGWRGIRLTLDNLPLLMTQLRAIIRAAQGNPQVHIILPMISTTQQIDQCIALVHEAFQQLQQEKHTVCLPPLGIMVEVPASISQLPLWHKKLDFISIGTNDLSQYLLATDRNNALVAKNYDVLHPAVIHEIKRIVDSATSLNLPLSLCGEMAADPIAVMLLLGMGVRTLSLSSSRIPLIKWIISHISIEETQTLLQASLLVDNAEDIRQLGRNAMAKANIPLDS